MDLEVPDAVSSLKMKLHSAYYWKSAFFSFLKGVMHVICFYENRSLIVVSSYFFLVTIMEGKLVMRCAQYFSCLVLSGKLKK